MTTNQKITLAGGCFWCIDALFEPMDGILSTCSGYIGGHLKNPTYEDVTSGISGHLEAVEIYYDETILSFTSILTRFFEAIDPTDAEGQFADRGSSYCTCIFYHTPQQKKESEEYIKKLNTSKIYPKAIATKIKKATQFYPAETYHQKYHLKNPIAYKQYHRLSGRNH